jgi:hypothetical protein
MVKTKRNNKRAAYVPSKEGNWAIVLQTEGKADGKKMRRGSRKSLSPLSFSLSFILESQKVTVRSATEYGVDER